jgi:hypothetical protein
MASGLDRRYASFPHELPLGLFEEKLSCLTDCLGERFGRPRSYRAGRWGIAAEHLGVLERLGYQVDTSVLPLEDFRKTWGIPASEGGKGGVDFRFAPCVPYHPSQSDIARLGASRVVEVPVTATFPRWTPGWVRDSYWAIPSAVRRALRRLTGLEPLWAKAAGHGARRWPDLLAALRTGREPVINVAVHSSEMATGGSPYTRTHGDTDRVFERIRRMLELAATDLAVRFMTAGGLGVGVPEHTAVRYAMAAS